MEEHYINQAGTGFTYYSGSRYQKGHNWFGRVFRSGILPLIKYVGKKAFKTGKEVVRDVVMGDDLKESAKKHIKTALQDVADDAVDHIAQRGRGKRKRKVKGTTKPRKKVKRVS